MPEIDFKLWEVVILLYQIRGNRGNVLENVEMEVEH